LTGFCGGYPTPIYTLKSFGQTELVILKDSGEVSTNKLVVGETHVTRQAQADYNTYSNSFLTLAVANEVVIGLDENSELKLHSSTVNVQNRGGLPAKSIFTDKNHVMSLMSGAMDIVNTSSNGVVTVQTPRVSLTVKKGKHRIIVKGKTTIAVCLEGSMVIHNTIEGKSLELTSEKFAHVSTYQSLVSKGPDLLNNGKATAVIRTVSDDDNKRISETFVEMVKDNDSVMFVEVDNKTVGIKIR
jgi:hypothetical protein